MAWIDRLSGVFAEISISENDMDSTYIIVALAVFTIGSTLAAAVFHFGFFLKNPENAAAAKRVAADRESAATRMSSEGAGGRTLRQRLNDAPGLNDPLGNRKAGVSPWDAMTSTTWSDWRAVLASVPKR